MSGTTMKLMRKGLIWPPLVVLLLAGLAMGVARLLLAQINRAINRKTVVLEMSWKRGDSYYGPNFINLESDCLSNSQPGCFCSLDFKTTTSKEFANYIASFGSNKVPVKYEVDYDRNRLVVGASLESVGEWPEEKFRDNEKSLSTGFGSFLNHPSVGRINNPADCFPKSAK